ncbi:MAG: hypothetical protein AB1416_12360 [Actinomycetota bacterium]
MSMVVREGTPPIPVLYGDWAEWRELRLQDAVLGDPAPGAAGTQDAWIAVFCPTCWGQGRYLEPAQNGEGLVPRTCPACEGTGAVPG